jgi:hypothetical protein
MVGVIDVVIAENIVKNINQEVRNLQELANDL